MVLSCPLDFRYGRAEMKAIFSEEGKLQRLLAALVLLAAITVSPLGDLLIGPLGALTDRAAGSIF